jgi:hypothetical protein
MKPCTDSDEVISAFKDLNNTQVELISSTLSNTEKTKTLSKQIRKWHHFEFSLPNILICRKKSGDQSVTTQTISTTIIT